MPPNERVHAVRLAARPAVVARYVGELLLPVGLLTLVPAALALGFGELRAAGTLAGSAFALLALSAPLRRLPASQRLQANEAMAVAAAVFVLAPLAMVPPFVLSAGLGWLDALFEAISGVTTTGLTTLASVEGQSPSFLFTRSWMQWYGGLGMVTLSVALLGSVGLEARRLAVPGGEAEAVPESIRARARRALTSYGALTLVAVAALVVAGASPFDGLVHALAGVSTGGFSSHDDSLAGVGGWPAQAVAVAVGLCGAVSLPLYHRLRRLGPRVLWQDVEVRALIAGCLALCLLLGLALVFGSGMPPEQALRAAPLLATSAQTTTGFTPIPLAEVGPAAKLLLAGFMLAGGSVGSTAGGIKLLRVLIVLRMLQWAVRRASLVPHAVAPPQLGGERLSDGEVQRALVVCLLFLAVVGVSWLPFVASGYDPVDSLFEVVSATATVGLSTGISRPELEAPLKLVLCADMLLGRVEIVALLLLLSPGTWLGRRAA